LSAGWEKNIIPAACHILYCIHGYDTETDKVYDVSGAFDAVVPAIRRRPVRRADGSAGETGRSRSPGSGSGSTVAVNAGARACIDTVNADCGTGRGPCRNRRPAFLYVADIR
jgi:hypothetical protein